jgi:hypothetical protein
MFRVAGVVVVPAKKTAGRRRQTGAEGRQGRQAWLSPAICRDVRGLNPRTNRTTLRDFHSGENPT